MMAAIVGRIWLGSGEGDFSKRNNNELVNPGESNWKWMTVDEYAKNKFGGK